MPVNLITNGSFELPVVGGGVISYRPVGGTWSYTGNSGIVGNGSAFGNPNAPDGIQAGFIQQTGYFEQSVTFPYDGDYTFDYQCCNRELSGSQQIVTSINGIAVDTYTPPTQAYTHHTFVATGITAGTYLVRFAGTSIPDQTSFIDAITLTAPPPPSMGCDVSRFTNIVAGTDASTINVSRFGNVIAETNASTIRVSRNALLVAFNTRDLYRIGALRHYRTGRR